MQKLSSRYRRKYGQHFLKSKSVARRIVDFAGIDDKTVLEIGPGKGILTKFLAARARTVYAVEIERSLADRLSSMKLRNVNVIHDDFLQLRLQDFKKTVIVGNIPYSITKKIIKALVKQRSCIEKAVLMVQREYYEKMCAPVGSPRYGALALYANFYFALQKGFAVPARCFSPPPRVNSAIIALYRKRPVIEIKKENAFFDFVRGIFHYRRKLMRNALMCHVGYVPSGADEYALRKRPGDMTLDEFHALFTRISLAQCHQCL